MTLHTSSTSGSRTPHHAERDTRSGATSEPPWALILPGAVLVWALLLVGFQQVAQHVWGMSVGEAWTLAIGIMGYIAIFTGVVVGLALALRNERA